MNIQLAGDDSEYSCFPSLWGVGGQTYEGGSHFQAEQDISELAVNLLGWAHRDFSQLNILPHVTKWDSGVFSYFQGSTFWCVELDYKTQVRESCPGPDADSFFCSWSMQCLYFSLKIPCFDQLLLPAGNGCSTSHVRATSFCFAGFSSCSVCLRLLLSLRTQHCSTYLLGLFAGSAYS